MHSAPEDVKEGSDLEMKLKQKNLEFVRHNNSLLARRTNRLTDKGSCRVFVQPLRTKGWRRVGEARWSPEVHRVERIVRELVIDEEGRQYPVKEVLPVEDSSTDLKLVGRGLSVASQAKRDALGDARGELENYLESVGGQASLRVVGVEMRKTEFFEELAREGLSRRTPMDAFVALCSRSC